MAGGPTCRVGDADTSCRVPPVVPIAPHRASRLFLPDLAHTPYPATDPERLSPALARLPGITGQNARGTHKTGQR